MPIVSSVIRASAAVSRPFLGSSLLLAGTLACLVGGFSSGVSQEAVRRQTTENGVVLTTLAPPEYPIIARLAGIQGDVTVTLSIRKDGGVEAAKATNGPMMLRKPALVSAQNSKFECGECADAVTTYSLTYDFEIEPGSCSDAPINPAPEITQSPNRIIISARVAPICDPAAEKVRSAKCLYLWKCGRRESPIQ